jgi:transcriptional regulator with XRE-family HTH domain
MSASAFREARERVGISARELAAEVGMTEASYFDLEAYDEEAYMCLTLAQLRALADRLGTSPARLLDQNEGKTPLNAVALAGALRVAVGESDDRIAAFESQVGWELSAFLNKPETLLTWTPVALRDLCDALRLDWVSALPETNRRADV